MSDPITNPAILFKMALRNAGSNAQGPEHFTYRVKALNATAALQENTFSTTEKIVRPGSVNAPEYETTYFVAVSPAGDPSLYDYNWDSTLSIKAYGTIYWNDVVVAGHQETKLTEVTGGWAFADRHVRIISRTVNYGASGFSYGHLWVTQASDNHHPGCCSFTYYAPSSWVPISFADKRAFGENTQATLTVGGGTWGLTLFVEYN